MPITIIDYVKSIAGDQPAYHEEDFTAHGVAMAGGCECCCAVLAAYNAYPSKTGSWRCATCIGDTGYASVAEFTAAEFGPATCPACGGSDITEVHATVGGSDTCFYACGSCDEEWPQ